MGNHLDVVCLFQAAEIERLIDNLDDFKLRYMFEYLDLKRLKRKNLIGIAIRFKLKS